MEELPANKVLALFDRAETRDFLDLAAEKDTGFDTAGFLESIASLHRFTAADFGIATGDRSSGTSHTVGAELPTRLSAAFGPRLVRETMKTAARR